MSTAPAPLSANHSSSRDRASLLGTRGQRVAAAIVVVLGGGALAFFQHAAPAANRPQFPAPAWWFSPVVLGARSQQIGCDLRAVFAIDDRRVWVAGALGFVARSEDGGQSWTRETVLRKTTFQLRPVGDVVPNATPPPPSNAAPPPPSNAAPPAIDTPQPIQTKSSGATGAFLELVEGTAHAEMKKDQKSAKAARAPVSSKGSEPAPTLTDFDPRKSSSYPSNPPSGSRERTEKAARGTGTDAKKSPPHADSPRPAATLDFLGIRVDGARSSDSRPPTRLANEEGTGELLADDGRYFLRRPMADGSEGWVETDSFADARDYPAWPLHTAQLRGERPITLIDGLGSLRFLAPKIGDDTKIVAQLFDSEAHYRAAYTMANDGVFFVDNAGQLARPDRGPRRPIPRGTDVQAIAFIDVDHGWAVGERGRILATADGGVTWKEQQPSGAAATLRATFILDGGRYGWAVGDEGTVLGTVDGGARWTPLTEPHAAGAATPAWAMSRPWGLPAPWYLLSLLAFGLVLAPALRAPTRDDAPPEETVADLFVSDRPLNNPTGDVLDLNGVALGVSRFLRNEGTLAPLTVAVTGEWGTGKSSLMNLLRADLMRFGFRPVWFNAWHHQKEEHLLAALLQSIRLQAVPGWFNLDGLRFRWNLLRARGWRFWLPLGAATFVLSTSVVFEATHARGDLSALDRAWNLVLEVAQRIRHGELDAALQALGAKGSSLGLLGGAVALFATLRSGLRAFGVDPGALLAGISGGAKPSAMSAKTSFRQKFAVELRDVTRALGVRSMIVFIDDLDRCRPNQVVEMLEAVNFVVSSGDCFVILGMAPERVIPCIALSFKDVAAEMRAPSASAPPAPTAPTGEGRADVRTPRTVRNGESPRQKRARFAREYLDKLINIEVPVPTPSTEQAVRLLVDDDARRDVDPHTVRLRRPLWARGLGAVVAASARYQAVAPTVLFGAFILAVIGGGAIAGRWLGRNEAATETAAPSVPAPVAGVDGGATEPSETLAADARNPGNKTTTATPATAYVRRDHAGQSPTVVDSPTADTTRWIVPLAIAIFLGLISWIIINRRPDPVVRDSNRFSDALRIWNGVVFAHRPTPRALKRFLNRVRYLAMRQRSTTPVQSVLDRILAMGDRDAAAPLPPVAAGAAAPRLLDENLVALAALHETRWEAFTDPATLELSLPALLGQGATRAAWEQHVATFGTSLDDLVASAAIYVRHAYSVRTN